MAQPAERPLYKQAWQFALDVAEGRHALSKLMPVLLWGADAVLCGLIIWKVPCKFRPTGKIAGFLVTKMYANAFDSFLL